MHHFVSFEMDNNRSCLILTGWVILATWLFSTSSVLGALWGLFMWYKDFYNLYQLPYFHSHTFTLDFLVPHLSIFLFPVSNQASKSFAAARESIYIFQPWPTPLSTWSRWPSAGKWVCTIPWGPCQNSKSCILTKYAIFFSLIRPSMSLAWLCCKLALRISPVARWDIKDPTFKYHHIGYILNEAHIVL